MTRETDIVHEKGRTWVYRDKASRRYTVFVDGLTHSVSDSAYPFTEDGLSIAIALCNYLASRTPTNEER